MAALAAASARKQDITRLKGLLEEAHRLAEGDAIDPKSFSRLDVRFHIAMAEIAANPLFVAVLWMVHENVLEAFERLSVTRNLIQENFQDLCDIGDAVK